MTPETRKRLIEGLNQTYNNVGYDCWGEKIPGKSVFVEIICDQLRSQAGPRSGSHGRLTDEEVDEFFALSKAERRRMCLEVGP